MRSNTKARLRKFLVGLLALTSSLFALQQTGEGQQLTQSVVAGGGGVSTAGAQRLEGTIGQGVAGVGLSGGTYTLDGGFVAATAHAYSVSGRVTLASGGAPLAFVTVTLTRPDSTTATTATDSGGNYSFAGLDSGSYSVTPSKTNYSFTPSGRPVTVGTADQTGVNFTAASNATVSPAGRTILVSEFRLQGPAPSSPPAGDANGELDEFIELYNNTNAAADISGFKVDTSTGFTVVIPANTVLPARGHYLIANGGGYSLSAYAAPDQTYSGFDLPTDAGLALLDTSNRIVDAVGFTTSPAPYKEGAGLQAVTASVEYTYFRKECDLVPGVPCAANGYPKDTNVNSADFLFADTAMTNIAGITRRLGAPGPQNSASPIKRDDTILTLPYLDSTKPQASQPNLLRVIQDNPGSLTSSKGLLYIRRRLQNTSATTTVTRVRFRIMEMTTGPTPPAGTADLRALTAPPAVTISGINDPATCASTGTPTTKPCKVTVQPTVLEEPPSQGTNGGGYNSTLMLTLPGGGLAPGASVDVNFMFGVMQGGTYRFYVIIEALP